MPLQLAIECVVIALVQYLNDYNAKLEELLSPTSPLNDAEKDRLLKKTQNVLEAHILLARYIQTLQEKYKLIGSEEKPL